MRLGHSRHCELISCLNHHGCDGSLTLGSIKAAHNRHSFRCDDYARLNERVFLENPLYLLYHRFWKLSRPAGLRYGGFFLENPLYLLYHRLVTTVARGGSFVQQKKRVEFLRPQNATYLLYHRVATTVPLSALTTLYIYYTPWIATFSAPVSIVPPDYQPLIRYIYCTTGLPFGGAFIIPPGGKPFRGVSILPRGLQGSPLFKTPVSIIPPGYHNRVLSALTTLYIYYISPVQSRHDLRLFSAAPLIAYRWLAIWWLSLKAPHPLYPRDWDVEGVVSAPERLNDAPLVSYHWLAIIEF